MPTALEHATALYMDGIRDGNPREAVAAHTGARYTQHSTGVPDGPEGFVAFFEDFLQRNPKRDIVRGWQDGRYVFLQAYQSLNDGQWEYVTTDFFDSDEDGRIVEHWDVITEFRGAGASGRTAIDGPTEVTDLDRTEQNKAVVRALVEDALLRGGPCERIEELVAPEYLQHNADVPDGRDAFAALARAQDRPLNYERIVLLVGSGNFVATLCEAEWEGSTYAQVDIFRLEDGRIVEHWDNVEPVPADPVNSGKF